VHFGPQMDKNRTEVSIYPTNNNFY